MSRREHYGTLTNKDLEKAKRELFEDPKTRPAAIERFRKTVLGFPGLTCPTDDGFLLRFLRARKFDEDRALQLLKNYVRGRNAHPEIFDKFRPSLNKEFAETHWHNVLPFKDDKGQIVVWIRFSAYDPNLHGFEQLIRLDLMGLELLLDYEDSQINGVTFICDMADFGMTKAIQLMTPSVMKKVFTLIQDGMPFRLRGIHHVNEPLVIGYVWPILKSVLKQKIVERVSFNGCDMKNLHQYFSPDILPPELGGTLTDYPDHRQKWLDKFLSLEDKFAAMENYKLVEDTPGLKGEDFKADALQGMSGTFRKLNLD